MRCLIVKYTLKFESLCIYSDIYAEKNPCLNNKKKSPHNINDYYISKLLQHESP